MLSDKSFSPLIGEKLEFQVNSSQKLFIFPDLDLTQSKAEKAICGLKIAPIATKPVTFRPLHITDVFNCLCRQFHFKNSHSQDITELLLEYTVLFNY